MVVAAAGITAAGSLAGAAISGSKGGGGSANAVQDSSHTPWGPQGQAIQQGLTGAQQVYDHRTQAGPYSGDLYAGVNQFQNEAMRSAYGYAGADGAGPQAVGYARGVAQNGTQNFGQGLYNAGQIAQRGLGGPGNQALMGALQNIGSGQQQVGNPALNGAVGNAAVAGANSIGHYNSGLSDVMSAGMSDPTQQLAGDAQTYMNSGATQQMLDNANNQISRTLNQTTLPGLNRQAAMGGNLNSSRAGMAEAMAGTDAALAMGNADAQIMNNSFNQGLGVASAQRTAGLNTAASAASAGLTGNSNFALGAGNQGIAQTQAQISAANAGLSQQTNRDTANTSAMLAGNSQLLGGVNTGLIANQQGQALASGNAGLLANAGGLWQGNDQAALNAKYQQWQMQNQYQQGVLNDYMTNVTKPQGYYDTHSTSTSRNSPDYGKLLAGGATALGSAFAPGGAANGSSPYSLFSGNGTYDGSYRAAGEDYWGGNTYGGASGFGQTSGGAQTLADMGFYTPLPGA